MNNTARLVFATSILLSSGTPFAADPPVASQIKVETAVGNAKIYTRAAFSCQKASKKIAIELNNGTSPDAQNVLKPNRDPRILCKRANASEEIKAEWDVNEGGIPVTRDLGAQALRQCASIAVVQELALPQGWSQKSSKVEFEIAPAGKELDPVFVACGGPAPVVATPVAMKTEATWQTAQVITGSKTNVRGAPNTTAAIVAQLEPGVTVLVQKTGNEWWRAKPEKAPGFEGYIRNDRLVFK